MFLIKTAFWLSTVILLLPADPKSGAEAPRVSAIEALVAARAAVTDLSGFCERNPSTCVTGHAAVEVFVDKARYGAGMLYHYFNEAKAPAPAGEARNTLKTEDIAPAWRAPRSGRPA